MNNIYITFITFIIGVSAILSGCIVNDIYIGDITGKYVGTGSNITFYPDGKFTTDFKDYSLSGSYTIDKDEVIIKYELMGATYRLKIKDGGKLLVYEESTWIKT